MFLVCPVLWLIFAIDYKSVFYVFKSISFSIILILLALLFFRLILQSVRFWFLITPFSKEIKLSEFIALDWKARYYALIMPSSAGQDITRAVLLKNHLSSGVILAISVFFRVTGIITLVLLSIFGFLKLYSEQNLSFAVFLAGVVILAACAVLFVCLSENLSRKILSLLPKRTPKKLVEFFDNASRAVLLYKKHPKLVISTLFFSFVLHLWFLLFPIISIYAVCGEFKIIEVFTFIPLIEILAAVIPFAPSGAGIREGLMILFFNIMNQTKEQAFSYITIYAIVYLMPLFGFFVVVFDKIKKRV